MTFQKLPGGIPEPQAHVPRRMKKHDWRIEEVDGGPVGIGRFWKCVGCGASGGPVGMWDGDDEKPVWPPFLSGFGPGNPLSEDCEIAVGQIERLLRDRRVKEAAEEARRAEIKRARRSKKKLLAEADLLRRTLEDLMECPFTIDSASVPKAGIEARPEQVVGVLSVAYLRYQRALDVLKRLK
jgi:hypothetical protein